MSYHLSSAERQLLSLYTRQAYTSYLDGKLKETGQKVEQIEALNPGDVNARFLRGALIGRKARPGPDMQNIQRAVAIWKPLYVQLTGEAAEAMRNAIEEALTTILYIPVDLASRQWDVYCNGRAAEQLKETVNCLLKYEEEYAAQKDIPYAQWIRSLFVKNYVFLVDDIVGLNKPFPVGENAENVHAYEETLTEVLRMAERIPPTGDSEIAVRKNAADRLERLKKHNRIS